MVAYFIKNNCYLQTFVYGIEPVLFMNGLNVVCLQDKLLTAILILKTITLCVFLNMRFLLVSDASYPLFMITRCAVLNP